MFKKTKVCQSLMLAFGSTLAIGSSPALAQQQLQRVEITGSAIKRVQSEGPAPVEVYSRRDIERSGATTITELVKNISSLDIDDQGELTGNSPSGSGTTNLQIRGLSERNLLILLNGRRLPVNALHDGSGAGAAVDVNNIPISAIDRIEVLKDGGSAIYGADAVAGVINFITRKNYTGVEGRVGFGQSSRSDATEKSAGLVFGVGDYETQNFNILGALDLFQRDPIKRKDRDITKSANWRPYGGRDGRSSFHPSGNQILYDNDVDFNVVGVGQIVPCPPDDLPLSGGFCLFDFSKGDILDSTNGADRISGMMIGSLKLGNNMRAFGELTYAESKDLFLAQPAPGVWYNAAQVSDNFIRFMQPGPRTTNRKASMMQAVVGVEGTTAGLDWDVAAGQGMSKVTNSDSNYLKADDFFAALDAGTIDPTSLNNPTAVVDALRLTPQRKGKSVLKFVDAKVSGQFMELAGGPLAWAAGVHTQRETLSDRPDANSQAGNVFGSIAQAAVDASRSSSAVFGELSVPFFKGFESQFAMRYDRYPGNSKTSPKVAFKYQPLSSVLVRASYAESFLAPSLKQLFGGQEQGAESVDCTAVPLNEVCAAFNNTTLANFPYQEVSGSNPNLKPETGKTYNIGLILEPAPEVSIGLDYWLIKKKDEISTLSVESAAARGDVGRSAQNEALVFVTNQNVAAAKVEGIDVDLRLRLGNTPFGKLSVRNAATYYIKSQKQFEEGGPFFEYVNSFLTPRWRNNLNVNLESGPWSTSFIVRTTASMKDTDQPFGEPASNVARKIDSHEEIDTTVVYTGVKSLTLTGGIKNLFDRQPPFSNTGASNQYGSLGFPWIYSPRGRFFFVSANYKFF